MAASNESTLDLLRDLAGQRFWGVLTLKFQHGDIVHITKEESIQPSQLLPDNRRTNDQHIRDGKSTKVPINPHTGGRAKTNDPATWGHA